MSEVDICFTDGVCDNCNHTGNLICQACPNGPNKTPRLVYIVSGMSRIKCVLVAEKDDGRAWVRFEAGHIVRVNKDSIDEVDE